MELVDRDVPGPKRDLVGYGRQAPRVRWPNGARVCVSICLNYEEGSEYSRPAGDTRNEGQGEVDYVMEARYRDFAVESVYEYGSRAGVWRRKCGGSHPRKSTSCPRLAFWRQVPHQDRTVSATARQRWFI